MKNGYQLCPKCDGSGLKFQPIPETSALAVLLNFSVIMPVPYRDKDGNIQIHKPDNTYAVCNGKMVISTTNGLPPKD